MFTVVDHNVDEETSIASEGGCRSEGSVSNPFAVIFSIFKSVHCGFISCVLGCSLPDGIPPPPVCSLPDVIPPPPVCSLPDGIPPPPVCSLPDGIPPGIPPGGIPPPPVCSLPDGIPPGIPPGGIPPPPVCSLPDGIPPGIPPGGIPSPVRAPSEGVKDELPFVIPKPCPTAGLILHGGKSSMLAPGVSEHFTNESTIPNNGCPPK